MLILLLILSFYRLLNFLTLKCLDCGLDQVVYGTLEKVETVNKFMKIQLSNRISFKLNVENFNIWDKTLKKIRVGYL